MVLSILGFILLTVALTMVLTPFLKWADKKARLNGHSRGLTPRMHLVCIFIALCAAGVTHVLTT